MLIETRAKGGNLLLNVGPMSNGEIPLAQSDRMQEMALWLFANGESIYNVRPLETIREPLAHGQTAWYLRSTKEDAIYALLTGAAWPKGERRTITLKTIRAGESTEIELLGQSGQVLEYRPTVNPKASWHQDEHGLNISAMRAQRLYNNSQWPNPVVIKMTNVVQAK
jgi:alpha-L-fucosidase